MNVEKMCRVCLSEFDELTPLWVKLPGENKTLEETINFVVNINIKLEDGLPDKICKICESILDLADTFKKRCLESESILEQQAQGKQSEESRPKYEINYQENSETHSNDTSCLPTSISRTLITDSLREITENDENIYDLPEYKIKMEIDELDVDSGTTICNQEHLDTIQAATKSNESCIVKEEVPEQSRYLVNKEMLSCPHCSLTFQTKISYKAHIFSTHEPKDWRIFNCALCKDIFTCKDSFEAHLRTHGRQNMSDIHSKHVQNISGYSQPVTFPSEGEDTTDHAPPTEANKMDKFECFNCKEIFTSFDSIKAHLRTHTKQKIKTISTKAFLCNTCDQRFSSETGLMKHIQALHNSCKESRRELRSNDSMESHKLELRKDAPSPNEPKLDDMQPTTAAVRSPTEDPAAADTSTDIVIETEQDLEKVGNVRITRKKTHEMNLKRNPKLVKKRNINKSEKASTQNSATMPKQPSIKTHNKITSATEKQSKCTYKTNSNSKIHTCDICGYTTPTVKTLNAHLKAHAATKQYSCNTCGYLSINSDHYNIHMRTHTGEKPYSCELCGKKFSVKTTLLRHVRTHTGEIINNINNNFNYTCEVCGKKFRHKNNLLRHVRIHTGDTAFSCNVCENKFTQKHHLVRHLRTHTGEKPYSCDVCQRKFNVKHILDRHLRTHTDGKIYSCHVCQKQFSFKWNLVAHLRTHTGEKPYSCDVCLRRFSERQHIVMHMRTHTGEKPYSCDECEKKFNQRRYLVRHLKRHTGEKPYSCDVCLRRFSKRHHIVTHLRTHTGEKPCSCIQYSFIQQPCST